ncbi:MAG: hypothetical protein N2Z84_00170 [Atribacterota bacterium]|nr:hypothetical protein [Atribacterota bacterium]
MLGAISPIFILVGLFDVWISRKLVAKRLGATSKWSAMKISVLLFEVWSLSGRFALIYCVMSFVEILAIAFLLERLIPPGRTASNLGSLRFLGSGGMGKAAFRGL